MDPDVWGPLAWNIMFDLSRAVHVRYVTPDEAEVFLRQMAHLLPCEDCQTSFQKLMRKYPPPSQAQQWIKWIYEMRKKVCEKKASKTLGWKEWQERVDTYDVFAPPSYWKTYLKIVIRHTVECLNSESKRRAKRIALAEWLRDALSLAPHIYKHVPHMSRQLCRLLQSLVDVTHNRKQLTSIDDDAELWTRCHLSQC